MTKKLIHVRVSLEILKQIKMLCIEKDTTVQGLIEGLIESYLTGNQKPQKDMYMADCQMCVHEWIKVNKFGEMPAESPYLLMDEYGSVSVGFTAFDYYDAKYWCPMPRLPFTLRKVMNDAWISND